MERPTRFEHHRFLGDKRNQRVYDLDTFTDEDVIAELMARRDLPVLRPRHPRRGPQPRLPPRAGPPRRRRRGVAGDRAVELRFPSGGNLLAAHLARPPMRADTVAGARRGARPRLPERRRAPPPWRRRRSPSWPTAWRPRWGGWPWPSPSAAAASPRAASRSAGWLDDLGAAVGYLRDNERVTGVWLAGFGTGGALALCAAAADPEVRGVATLGAPGRLRRLGLAPEAPARARPRGRHHQGPDVPRRRRRLDPRAPRDAGGRLRAEGRARVRCS